MIVILLALVGIFSVVTRFITTIEILSDPSFSEPDPASFEGRYNVHPYLTLLHIIPGFLFMALGPLQLIRKIRSRWIQVHRWSGRIYLVSALVTGVGGIILTFRLPIFGTFTATVAALFFMAIFLFALVKGYLHIRRGEIVQHREWMIRAFALGLGISSQRVLLGLLLWLFDLTFVEAWDTAVWSGFVIMLLSAEIWINVTRPVTVNRRKTRTVSTKIVDDRVAEKLATNIS
ncbi:DUF2306 domain-containing protein [Chloroflexi bacterium TSY]|nr:DUF2306 domain-containing protein [Chloroflexi bacterium TSY]